MGHRHEQKVEALFLPLLPDSGVSPATANNLRVGSDLQSSLGLYSYPGLDYPVQQRYRPAGVLNPG